MYLGESLLREPSESLGDQVMTGLNQHGLWVSDVNPVRELAGSNESLLSALRDRVQIRHVCCVRVGDNRPIDTASAAEHIAVHLRSSCAAIRRTHNKRVLGPAISKVDPHRTVRIS